jgi:chromate transporter
MLAHLLYLLTASLLISVSSFGGGAQALFYQFGVLQTHWITRGDLSAVLAFGYATPGPAVFGTATFIGYKVDGTIGATVGTIGIFIVPFLASVMATKYFGHLLHTKQAEHFVIGVGLAAAGVVAATAFGVLHSQAIVWWQLFILVGTLYASIKYKVNPLFLLLAGGLLGFLL